MKESKLTVAGSSSAPVQEEDDVQRILSNGAEWRLILQLSGIRHILIGTKKFNIMGEGFWGCG